jgi:TonB family protein
MTMRGEAHRGAQRGAVSPDPRMRLSHPVRAAWALAIATAALGAYVLAGCAATPPKPARGVASPPVKDARPGPDFPSPEAFYPLEARRLAIEGTAVVSFCTDEAGRLSGMPAVIRTSGNPYLDAAAVLVATAGNGHYLPATRDGIAVAGCSKFGVRFVMFRDPRWPTIAGHVIRAEARVAVRVRELDGDWRMPAPPATTPTVRQQLEGLQEVSRRASSVLEPTIQAFDDYLASIDAASAEADVPDAERRAFLADWGPKRAQLRQSFDETAGALRGLLGVMNDMIAFLETLPPNATRDTPTGPQRAHLDALTNRGRALYEKIAASRRLWREISGEPPAAGQSPEPGDGFSNPH